MNDIHERDSHQAAISADFHGRQLKMLLNDLHTTLLAQDFEKRDNFCNQIAKDEDRLRFTWRSAFCPRQ